MNGDGEPAAWRRRRPYDSLYQGLNSGLWGGSCMAAIYEVEVIYTKLNDGTIKISDAWINQ